MRRHGVRGCPAFVAAVVLLGVVGAPRTSEAFLQHTIFESTAGTVYSIWYNDGSLGAINILTQLVATNSAVAGVGDSSSSFVTEFVTAGYAPGQPLVTPFGQSAILDGIPVGADDSGTGTIFLTGGQTFGIGDFGAFAGQLTTHSPDPSVQFPGLYDPGDYYVFGFNLPPGVSPTTTLLQGAGFPPDGVVLGPQQTLIFGLEHDPITFGLGVGGIGFYFAPTGALLGGGYDLDGVGGRAAPPVIPEPTSLMLCGIGGASALFRRSRSRRRMRPTATPC